MTRAIGIPVSLAVLVGVPLAITPAPTPKAEAPKAIESQLTVQANDRDKTTCLRIDAAGAPPAKGAPLVSDDGLKSGRVAPTAKQSCDKAPLRHLGGSAGPRQTWKLKLIKLPDHGKVVGTIAGKEGAPSTELELTVQRRVDFARGGPLALLLLGLLAGLAVAVAVPWLSGRIGAGRLGFVVAVNAIAPVARRIGGLAEWVAARRAAGDDAEQIRTKIQPVVDQGPAKATEARAALETALRSDPLGKDHPLALAARNEARRTDHAVGEFLDAKGDGATHPAATLRAAITTMTQYRAELDAMRTEMTRTLKRECYPPEVTAARLAWARAAAAEELPGVDEAIAAARTALDLKLAVDDCLLAGPEGDAAWDRERSFGGLAVASQLSLQSSKLLARLLVPWMFATVLCIVIALVFAGTTVAVAAYDAKPEYGTWQDHFALFSAALASGAAATVVGLLAPWGVSPKDAGDT